MAENSVEYKYYVVNIVTNQVVGELPMNGVSYQRALKDAGSFSGTISLSEETQGIDVYSATMPGKNAIYVTRNGVCVWGGPIWSRSYDVVAKTVSINANEFTSYYQHRKIWKTWNLTHSGCLVYVDPDDSSQLIVELNSDTGDTIDIEEGIAVELAFTDKKGYNLNGHFRVNDTFYNATKITLDKEALQWNVHGVSHVFKTKGDTLAVDSRKVTAGSKEIVITTPTPHSLAVGDTVNVKNLEDNVSESYFYTYKTLPTEYNLAALASTSVIYRYGTATNGSFTITGIETRGISIGANISQLADPNNRDSNKGGIIPTEGLNTTVTAVTASTVTFKAYAAGSSTSKAATRTGKVYLKFENKKPGYGYKYVNSTGKLTYTMQPKDYSWKGKVKFVKDGTLIKTNGVVSFSANSNDAIFGELPTTPVSYSTASNVTNGNTTITVSSTRGISPGFVVKRLTGATMADTEVSEVINGTQFTVAKAPTSSGAMTFSVTAPAYHKVEKIISAVYPKSRGEYEYLKAATDYVGVPTLEFSRNLGKVPGGFSGYTPPAVDATFNIVEVKKHELPDTKSRAAMCANGDQPVIRVIDRKTFVVNACEDGKYDNTNNNPGGTIAWDGKYQATMYTHTDTYEQVRYFLGNVHEDFVRVDANNPFLGNLEKYQIRTAKYDPATDLATITTGFRQSVYSKRIFFDYDSLKIAAKITLYDPYSQFDTTKDVGEIVKITGQDESINGSHYITEINSSTVLNSPPKSVIYFDLDASEQDVDSYSLSTVSADGSYITYTTSSAHKIRAGHFITVGGLSVTALNVSNALVVDTPSSTTVRVASSVANGTTDTTPNASIFTSDRLTAETRLVPDTSIITFGAHGLSAGNNIEVVGLSRENYEGTWAVSSVLDDVTFTYKPQFEQLKIARVKLEYVKTPGYYLVTVRVSKKPYFRKFSYIKKFTKITVSGLGSPYDGTHTVNDFTQKSPYEFSYKITGASGAYQVHPLRVINYSNRKYGTSYTISAASYTAETKNNKKTGRGYVQYTTGTTAHGFTEGQTLVVANVGGEFTQKTGNANLYSEYTVVVSTVPSSTTFRISNQTDTSNDALWKLKSGTDPSIGKDNTSITPTNASVIAYEDSTSRPPDSYPYLKIDDLPDVTSLTQLTTTVTGKAFNAKTKTVYLRLNADEGFVVGQKVIVEDVDDYSRHTIFDGTYVITGFEKVGNTYQLRYKSTNKSFKKDIGTFDDKETFKSYFAESASPGTVTVDAAVYVGSYGSFTQNSDIGLEFSTYEDSGNYQRVPTYRGHELKNVGEYLSEYSDKYVVKPGSTKIIRNVNGFEYRIDCEYDEINRSFRRIFKFLPIQYPNPPIHGEVSPPSRFGADKIVFEYPGNISQVSLDESAEEASTRFFMVGSDGGTGTSEASKSYVGVAHRELFADNWPTLDATESNDKLDFLSDISENAYRYLNETKPPSGVFQIGVVGNLDPVVNTYQPGDWCSIIVNDKFVRDRLASDLEPRDDVIVRKILSYTVTVPDIPSVPESVSLDLITEWDVDSRG